MNDRRSSSAIGSAMPVVAGCDPGAADALDVEARYRGDRQAEAACLRHIAFIPDGNRRWARRHGLSCRAGHRRGFLVTAPALIERAFDHGCEAVTIWMFSTENWRRSPAEVADLMDVYREFLPLIATACGRRGVRIRHAGRRDRLPADLLAALDAICRRSAEGADGTLTLGLDYGGSDALLQAVRALLAERPQTISDDALLGRLHGGDAGVPPIDLVVRTSGEQRLSGFMPLQAAYAELSFVAPCFPELTDADLDRIVEEFRGRDRRFGH